jgi:hypothetical protein
MFERLLYHLGLLCFPRDNTVLFYYNILRLSSLFTLRRSILTAVMLGLPLLSLWFFLSERLDLRCSTDIGRIIIRSNYDVRQILGGLLFVPITMFDRYWFYDLGVLFLFTTTLVLFYHTILRLSSLFTLRRSILTAVMLGLPLFISLVLSLREIGLGIGVSHPRDIMDFLSSFISSPPSIFTLYASPVDSYGGYAWVATFYLFVILSLFLSFLISHSFIIKLNLLFFLLLTSPFVSLM